MKKFLAIILSLILLIGLMPCTVFAGGEESQEVDLSKLDLASLLGYTSLGTVENGYAKLEVEYSLSEGESIASEEVNYLTISVTNKGNVVKDAELVLTTPAAAVTIQSGSTKRSIGTIVCGGTESVTFPIVCVKDIPEGSYQFGISINGEVSKYPRVLDLARWGLTGVSGEDSEKLAALLEFLQSFGFDKFSTVTDAFYLPVTVPEDEKEDVEGYATPRLMLTNYNCGGNVQAGASFGLGLTLKNTSKVDLYNIKVTVDTSGRFVPVGSSNSFYIDSVAAGESVNKTLTLSCSKDLPQEQYAITVHSEYEDEDGKAYQGSDTISIPVVQKTRLVVDDILDPGWLTMGDTAYANVSYRNMGNNQIANLTIKVEGDFDVEGNNVYYVGNLASGKSDSYSFSFYPHQEGACNGTVIFTYEDAEGLEHHIDKAFSFNIGAAPNYDEPGIEDITPQQPQGMSTGVKIAIVVAAIIVLIVVLKLLKKRRAKKQEALELDE